MLERFKRAVIASVGRGAGLAAGAASVAVLTLAFLFCLTTIGAEWLAAALENEQRQQWAEVLACLASPSPVLFAAPVLLLGPSASLCVLASMNESRRSRIDQLLRQAAGGGQDADEGSNVLRLAANNTRNQLLVAAAAVFANCAIGFMLLELQQGTTVFDSLKVPQDVWRLAGMSFIGGWFFAMGRLLRRIVERDPTSAAGWTVLRGITVAPLLGALVHFMPTSEGSQTPEIVAFLVGAFPTMADRFIVQFARQSFKDERSSTALRPLANLAGMTLECAERLGEEGIYDAHHLANSNPQTLMLRTPFGLRRLLDWMDEALLYRYLQDAAFTRRAEAGITGSLDLVARWRGATPNDADNEATGFGMLAETLGVDGVTLWWICHHISSDAQYTVLAGLYNAERADDPSGLLKRGEYADAEAAYDRARNVADFGRWEARWRLPGGEEAPLALELARTRPQAWRKLAAHKVENHEIDAAVAILDAYLEAHPDSPDADGVWAQLHPAGAAAVIRAWLALIQRRPGARVRLAALPEQAERFPKPVDGTAHEAAVAELSAAL